MREIAEMPDVKEERITPMWMKSLETFIGSDGNKFAINLEKSIEKNIISMLDELGIQASVKTDRYSLPIHGIVSSSSGPDSYIPAIYDSSMVKRQFLKVLLNEDCRKVRFYVYVHTSEPEDNTVFPAFFLKRFLIEIRYYLHD
jgi:hypothetical protein